ncbi:hypothetical protein F2P81_001714 [Scophthalmus maximus]|uniref:Uncharacterized protein n=1 Tax=Scophthalmus maximus TaxID=52904 RepID=A0A6A4TIZ8_SCOMX|nr:hypothetical protein F2P81_001714 [Scophthalmus maximus]
MKRVKHIPLDSKVKVGPFSKQMRQSNKKQANAKGGGKCERNRVQSRKRRRTLFSLKLNEPLRRTFACFAVLLSFAPLTRRRLCCLLRICAATTCEGELTAHQFQSQAVNI